MWAAAADVGDGAEVATIGGGDRGYGAAAVTGTLAMAAVSVDAAQVAAAVWPRQRPSSGRPPRPRTVVVAAAAKVAAAARGEREVDRSARSVGRGRRGRGRRRPWPWPQRPRSWLSTKTGASLEMARNVGPICLMKKRII